MKRLYIKIITGFRDNQRFTVDMEEAHKAYRLFMHPEERTIFSDGTAVIGKNIQAIEPDYNATMGWLASHELDGDDWNEIRSKGVESKIRDMMEVARNVAMLDDPEKMKLPLSEIKLLE